MRYLVILTVIIGWQNFANAEEPEIIPTPEPIFNSPIKITGKACQGLHTSIPMGQVGLSQAGGSSNSQFVLKLKITNKGNAPIIFNRLEASFFVDKQCKCPGGWEATQIIRKIDDSWKTVMITLKPGGSHLFGIYSREFPGGGRTDFPTVKFCTKCNQKTYLISAIAQFELRMLKDKSLAMPCVFVAILPKLKNLPEDSKDEDAGTPLNFVAKKIN